MSRALLVLVFAVLLSGCATNTTRMELPLAPSEIEEIRSMAEDRSGIIHLPGADDSPLRGEVGSITTDSLQYSLEDGPRQLWSSFAEVSRIEFPYSRTRSALVGAGGGALGGVLSLLGAGAVLWLSCDGGSDCSIDWGSAALDGAIYGGLIGMVIGLLANEMDPPAFEFLPGR